MSISDVDSAFRALADPTRRRIIRLVANQELSAGEIARQFNTTRPAISQHLRILRAAGLLSEKRDGSRRLYQADTAAVESVIEDLRSFWSPRLNELKRQAEGKERHRRDHT
jgi:DNA-binding transcriptional ArsR family regulator